MTGIFTQYKAGLEQLLERLGKEHPRYAETLTLQSRLLENIAQARQYGDTDALKNTRAQIVDRLNQLTLQIVGVSFNELCKSPGPYAAVERTQGVTIADSTRTESSFGGSLPENAEPSGEPEWNTEAIRELLNAALDDEELTDLCYDHFRPVSDGFTLGMSRRQKIRRLLAYCDRQNRIPELLDKVRQANPPKFIEFKSRLKRRPKPVPPSHQPLTRESEPTIPDLVNPELYPIWQQRLSDLADHIAQDQALLKEYEDALRYEDDPRRRAKYLREIEQLRRSLARYMRKYGELEAQIVSHKPSMAMQDVAVKMQQMDEKLERRRLRQTLLDRYKADEQSTVTIPVEHLEQAHLATVQTILDALEADQVPDALMRQALDAVRQVLVALSERSTALPGQQVIADAIVEPTLDVKHKLKLTLPIIPMLLSYEGELELGSKVNLEAVWKRLEKVARPPYSRLLLVSVITALAFGLVCNVLASIWQLTMPQRLITTGVSGLAPAMTLWLGFHWAHVPMTKVVSWVRWVLAGFGMLFLVVAIVCHVVTPRCQNVQVSPCLELDLVTGISQEICPDDNDELVLPPNSLARLKNLSGRAILTHARGCTCDWEGQTKEGQSLTKLGGPMRDCSFSFELPEKPTSAHYLKLTVGEQRRLFTISVQR